MIRGNMGLKYDSWSLNSAVSTVICATRELVEETWENSKPNTCPGVSHAKLNGLKAKDTFDVVAQSP